jgi:DNA polymerase (family 10)
MENKTIARNLRLLSQLMELHGENSFKIKAVANAAFKVDKLPSSLSNMPAEEIEQINGLGKSMSAKIQELIQSGTLSDLTSIIEKTPEGIIEMLSMKGMGPKKIASIWKELQIENIGELYYACNENRLIEAKGFGLKSQEEVKKLIEFKMAAHGKFLYAQAEDLAKTLSADFSLWLSSFDDTALIQIAGDYRRFCEVIEQLEFVIGTDSPEKVIAEINGYSPLKFIQQTDSLLIAETPFGLQIHIHVSQQSDYYLNLFKVTGNPSHVEQVLKLAGSGPFINEEAIYKQAGLRYIEPELREGLTEIELARTGKLPSLITFKDLKGSLHNHSTWSDGVHTLEQMARYCKEELNLEYFGICDHSKSAFYAKGLYEDRVSAQQKEIDQLNEQLAPFKIFKGIESDILHDGSLDYADEVLQTFDFVVASVHSNLKMPQDKATARLIKAIENPYTTILGHPTGRLLLSRKGYGIDYAKVIDACAANQVVIEVNANPLRLDLDWRWHRYALEKGILLSINPDAHRMEGFRDMHYGVYVARKGGLEAEQCLNAFSLEQISEYFLGRKAR